MKKVINNVRNCIMDLMFADVNSVRNQVVEDKVKKQKEGEIIMNTEVDRDPLDFESFIQEIMEKMMHEEDESFFNEEKLKIKKNT